MASEQLLRDGNFVTVIGAITDDANQEIRMVRVDPITNRILASITGAGTGSVTSITAGTGLTATPNPITTTGTIALETNIAPIATLGTAGQSIRVNAGATALEYYTPAAGTGTVTSVSVTTANGVSGSVATATTTPAITLTLGAITPTTVNGLTISTTTGTLTVTNGKTLSVTNSLTLSGTDSTVMTFPTTSATIARTDAGQTFTGVQVMTSPSITTANLTGTQLLAENASIGLDPAGSADGKYTGITVTGIAGYTQAFGDLVYLDPTDSRWEAADANSAAGADGDARGMLAMVVVAGTDGNACTLLLNGIIRADAKFPSFTVNNPIYVSETAGAVTQTQPTTTDVVIRIVGAALTADEMYFNPDWTYITHT